MDSGNLAGCLIALTQGLRALPQTEAAALAQRAQSLEAQMRFAPLYDRKKRLFTICYDVERDKPSEGLYDLMASEARQTSYIAIARGEIERRHWARLSRALVGADGYKGMVSWTGTMFEYLMPELLLPSFDCSLLYESMRFCLYCQKKLGAARHTPWGMSESAFYSFDSALNYQYKAHGVSRLGLKRGLGQETVISPYSTFLALPLEPAASLRNLRRLRRLGLEGRYGLYEAADFTPLRLTSRQSFEPVKCFMAHHVGMSLIAVNNALSGGIMQKRFIQNSDMAAFAELLQERVPTDAVTIRAFRRELPEKPAHIPFEGWRQENDRYDAFLPGCTLIGNGSYTLTATDTGLTRRTCAGFELTRFAGGLCPDDPGLGIFLREGQRLIGFTPAPFFDKQVKYFSSLGGGDVKWTALCAGLTLTLTEAVPGNDNAELIEVTVENRRETNRSVELVLCAQPVLAPFSEYEAHPAFSRLFIETEMTPAALLVRRRPRADEAAPYLALCCDSDPLRFDTSREATFGRGGLSSLRAALQKPARGTTGAVLDPCLFLRLSLALGPGQKQSVRFALSFSDNPDYAVQAARRTLDFSLSHRLSRLDITARQLGLSHADVSAALNMLCDAQFITENRTRRPPGSAAPGQRRPLALRDFRRSSADFVPRRLRTLSFPVFSDDPAAPSAAAKRL